jgi:membrane protein
MARPSSSQSQSQSTARAQSTSEVGRGRQADAPSEVPKEGWLDILSRTKKELAQDNMSIVAAGVAFYWFLAFVPALGAVISIYTLVADPSTISSHLTSLAEVMPGEIMPMLREQMERLTSQDQEAGISAVIGLLIALYGSSKAATALIQGLNIAYDEEEKRGFFKLQAVALLLTLIAVVGAVVAIGLVAVLPPVLQAMHLGDVTETVATFARWPILVGGFMVALAVLYRYAPSRDEPRWRWVSWGAAVATGLWVIGSAAFSIYASTLGNYEKTYGSLGALVVFLFWLFLTAYVVLLGAELNSEMERQTKKDTTKGPPKPLGQRQAYSADTVGPARGQSGA